MRNFLTKASDWNFLDNSFEQLFAPIFNREESRMRTDIKEVGDNIEMAVDIPGFEKSDIDLSLENGYLVISTKKEETEQTDKYIRRERSYNYCRSYYVGNDLEIEDVKAKYQNGTLLISFPKEKEKKQIVNKIQID